MDNYISDNAISSKDEDQFQRYDYAKRIAETISSRTSKDNIVFGLYGKWGEGKSSVLRFIENELDKEKTLTVHFNPWRYGDEDGLLIEYFQTLAKALDKNIYSRKNRSFKFLKKFFSFTGELSKLAYVDTKAIGNILPQGNINQFKKRTEEFLTESNQKLIVFIDDIDRLDKDELFTLFRLIKLTADFSNTVYILSFDKEMVAKAIGQRFGNGDDLDGSSFLEKIIQIPVELPYFRDSELRGYTLGLVDEVLQKNNVKLSEAEQERYTDIFDDCLFEAINTPRSAIRYRNALEFSVPLLKGEVNMIDFIIFEGLKILYPDHVNFIKSHPDIFVHNYIKNNKLHFDTKEVDKEGTKDKIENLHKSLNESTQAGMRMALSSLFPRVSGFYDKNKNFSEEQIEKDRLAKRICNADYFERYLSYSVAKNEISDVEFSEFLKTLQESSDNDVSQMAQKFITNTSMYKFLDKIRLVENNMNWDQEKKLIRFLFKNSQLLKKDDYSFFDLNSSVRQASYFITRKLKKLEDTTGAESFLIEQIKHIENIDFLFSFLRVGIFDKNVSDGLFDEVQIKSIYQTSIDHTLKTLTDGEYLFDKYPILSREIMLFWIKIDITKSGEHLKNYLSSENGNVVAVLKSFVGLGYVTSSNGDTSTTDTYISDFDQETYDIIEKINCEDEIYQAINDKFSSDELFDNELYLDTKRQGRNTEINLVKQFLHFYQKDRIN